MRLALLAVLLLAAAAYAATWVVWVPVQNNSPSSGASSTFGNYWNYGSVFYSAAAVNWIVPPMPERGTAAFYNITSYLGASGAVSVFATSSQTTASSYMYSGAVSAAYAASLGSSTSITVTNGIFALAAVSISSEYCGSLYFVERFTLSAVSTAYVAAELANSTWTYLTFYSASNVGSGDVGLSQGLPSTCYSPGTYLLAVSIYVTGGQINGVAAIQVSTSSSGTGASYVPGTQYALSISPTSGDTVVFPWTTSASPYVVLMSAASVLNTAGSPASGYFSIGGTTPVYLPPNALLFRDSSTSAPSIAAANCPQNVYFLPASPSVAKLLTCSGMSAPSGAAVYPTDYSKYTSTATTFTPFSLPTGPTIASFQVSYTDSAGNAYSYSATTPYGFQPTNPSINSTGNQGYFVQLPQCNINTNPYGGGKGTFGLINCIAINYGAVSAVVWFYLPPSGKGVLLSNQHLQYPITTNQEWAPWLYVGTNGYLFAGDFPIDQISTPISPGWHMAVYEEWASSTSGPYYVALYLDGKNIGQQSGSFIPTLFGLYTYYTADDVGTGFTNGWQATPGGWWFFNGTIAYVALYNTILSRSQVQQLYQAGFPNTLFGNNLVASYMLGTIYYNNTGYYFVPYYVNIQLMKQMGINSYNAVSITPNGLAGAIPNSQFMANQLALYLSSFSISPSVQYAVFVRNPSIAVGGMYYVPVPSVGWAYVGPGYLPSPSVSGSTNVTTLLVGRPGVSYYPTFTVNGSALRLPFSPSVGSWTAVFYGLGGTAETLGVTPNGPPGTWFLGSNSTTYTIPSAPHRSTLVVPTTTGVFFAGSLGDWWNATNTPFYVAALVNGTSGPYAIQMNGQRFAASNFAWSAASPPNTVIYFTGTDGRTYAVNPPWVQGAGLTKILAGGGMPALYVWGRPISQSPLAFASGGVWLNYTQASGPYAYFPYFGSPGSMAVYANSTTSSVGSWALQIVDEALSPTSASSANVTVWMYNGALAGSFFFSRPFSYLAFPAGGSLGPLWLLLNSTVGVPPYIAQVFPSATQLIVSRGGYAAVNTYVTVPSQLFNQWSGNLVFAAAQMSPSGSYALMTGGFYSSPPTSFTIMLPVKAVGQLAYFLMASWPSGGTCSLLQQVSSPLELTICQGAASQNIAVNLGTATVSSPTSFSGLAGAWAGLAGRIAPASAILANAGVAALVVLMIRRGRSLTAGLMAAGALVTALGLSLWLPWMIGEGAVMFVIASAVAFTKR